MLAIVLFNLYVFFSQISSCDNTPENSFFQILSYPPPEDFNKKIMLVYSFFIIYIRLVI